MNPILAILLFSFWPFSNDEIKEEVSSIHNQTKAIFKFDPDSAIALVQTALEQSKETNYRYGEAKSYAMLGSIADRQNRTDSAVNYFFDALSKYIGMDDQKSLIDQANVCLTLGAIYYHHHRIQEAINFYEQGAEFALEAMNNKVLAKLVHNIAVAYRKRGELDKANELLLRKLEMIESDNHTERSYTYNELGLTYQESGDYEQAISYYNQVMVLETNPEPVQIRGQAYHNLANTYQQQKDYTKAWDYFNKALTELEPLHHAKDLFITYQDMADLALVEEKKDMALYYAQKATPLLSQVPETPKYFDQYKLLSRCIRETNPKQALVYSDLYGEKHEAFDQVQKHLIEKGEGYKIDLITTNYFNRQREKEQKIRFYLTLFSGLAFFLIAGYMSFKLWRIYRYESPEAALSMIKNPKELIYLFDLFRKEKDELKKTLKQQKHKKDRNVI